MTSQDNHFLGFRRVTDSNGTMGVRVLVGTDCASKQVRQCLPFGFRLLLIGKWAGCLIESLAH